MKRPVALIAVLSIVTMGFSGAAWATNETVEVQAKQKDNPQQNSTDIEGHFTQVPTSDKDEVRVTNSNVKGEGAGVYNDPVNDGALLTITQQSGPVKVDVEGREGIGAIYWITVVPTGGGGARGGGGGGNRGGGPAQRVVLWADVQDANRPGALVLKDTISGAGKSDSTDATGDTPTLYCTAPLPAGTADLAIRLNAEGGTYDWQIQQNGTPVYGDVLDSSNNYQATQSSIPPGAYVLVVTSRSDANFLRVINVAVIETGQYLPAEYPQDEIPVYSASENNPFYYGSGGGQIRSITVSAPVNAPSGDDDEGADNPYEYDTNYTITINPDDGTATVSLQLPGIYMLRIVRDYGGGQCVETFQTLSNGCDAKGALDPATWPWVVILKPHWDFYVGPATTKDVFKWSWNSVTISKAKWSCWNIAEETPATMSIERLVSSEYTARNNSKFNLCIDSHGSPGYVSGWSVTGIDKNDVAARLGNKIAGKVNRIRFYSCLTGRMPDGGDFLTNLKNAAGATEVSAYIQETSVSPWPYSWMAGNWGTKTAK